MPGRNGTAGAIEDLIGPSEDLGAYLLRQNEQLRSVIRCSRSLISGFADLKTLHDHYEKGFGATATILPYVGKPKGFVFHGGRLGLPELWCSSHETRRTCRRLFRNFLLQFFDIRMGSFPSHGVNADHVHPMTLARAEGQGYVRLLLTDAVINQGWGAWEDNAMQNDPHFRKTMTFAHNQVLLKLMGYPHPKFPLDRAYVEEAIELLKNDLAYDRLNVLFFFSAFIMTGMRVRHQRRLSGEPDGAEFQTRTDLFNKTRFRLAADLFPEYKPTDHTFYGKDDPDWA